MNYCIEHCSYDELKEKKSVKKFIDEVRDEVIVFLDSSGAIKAFTSVCPHMAGEINLVNNSLICKWHGLHFNEAGLCNKFNGKIKLTEYPTIVRNGCIYIQYEK